MTILENPAPSSSFRNWQNIATGYGAFCVQERTAAARRPSVISFAPAEKPFRIIFSHCPIDFLSLTEKLSAKSSTTGLPSSAGSGNKRFVVAVASSLATILEDWGWVMKGWQTVGQRTDSAMKRRTRTSRTAGSSDDALTREEWSEVVQVIKEQLEVEREAEYVETTTENMLDEEDGGKKPLSPSASVRDAALLVSRDRRLSVDDSLDTTPEVSGAPTRDDTFLAELEEEPANKVTGVYFYTSDIFDIILLRHIDVWAWSSPHVTILMIMVCFAFPWNQALVILLAEALPLSLLQRRRAVDKRTKKRDQRHLETFSKLFSKLGHLKEEEPETKVNPFKQESDVSVGEEEEEPVKPEDPLVTRVGNFMGTFLAKVLFVAVLLFALFNLILPRSVDLLAVADAVVGKVVGAALLLCGVRQVLKPPVVNRRPLSRKAITNLLASTQRNIHPHIDNPSHRYVRPELSESEKSMVDQLRNFGAPYPLILLRPLRDLSVATGWTPVVLGEKVRCEHRYSNNDTVHSIRYSVNVPLANVGTMQAVLLDDVDGQFDELHSSNLYTWDTLLQSRQILKKLDYNLYVVRYQRRSSMWGVPSSDLDQFVIPAVVLNSEQQKALNISDITPRPPAAEGRRKGHGNLRAFLQCAIPCPESFSAPYVEEAAEGKGRSPTSKEEPTKIAATSLLLGLEEADGSLTLCLYRSYSGVTRSKFLEEQRLIMGEASTHCLAYLLEATGYQPSQIADFSNASGFQPFFCRQPFTDLPAEEEENVDPGDDTLELPAMGARNGVSPERDQGDGMIKRQRSLRFMSTLPLPTVCQTVVRDALQSNLWRLRKTRGGVRVMECTRTVPGIWDGTPHVSVFCAQVVVSCNFFHVMRTLSRNSAVTVYNDAVESRVPLGSQIPVAELLATVEEESSDEEEAALTGVTSVNVSPPVSTVLKQVGEVRGTGSGVYHTAFRGKFGAVARDAITKEHGPYFFTAKSLREHLFDATQSAEMDLLRELPNDTRMCVRVEEDPTLDDGETVQAGKTKNTTKKPKKKREIVPPLMDYERCHVHRRGVLCYEIPSKKEGVPQTMVMHYSCAEPSGWLPKLYANVIEVEQLLLSAEKFKTLVEYSNKEK
ncbi:hypothetical protein AGDE_13805 [Angomonas deanei]|uniref:START domain-containing protein n=1 Tax=Angomonas deanei TaxID=59799 RepID=A0A7G2CSU9_9TRYP|nr:hypothetical protein AGDE_13805 [Angomonas deanei]CAD2222840.1 hypothetical protein, conserved [Angomonas deanei]|eukprot:EPY21750.1 hypothetical protein AGDE_13805 [Angomonas deanei]